MLLETERLLLREFEDGDWPAVYEYYSDAEVFRYQRGGPYSAGQAREYVGRAIVRRQETPGRHYELAVVLKSESRLIGAVRLSTSDPANRQGDIGYDLNRHYWGRGLGTEAATKMVDFGFGELCLHRIWSTCNADNKASARVLEKCGMRLEAHYREHLFVRGVWRDDLLYAILEQEWRAQSNKP